VLLRPKTTGQRRKTAGSRQNEVLSGVRGPSPRGVRDMSELGAMSRSAADKQRRPEGTDSSLHDSLLALQATQAEVERAV
jgi:hypothetical protein